MADVETPPRRKPAAAEASDGRSAEKRPFHGGAA